MAEHYLLGVDTGGTFTDFVLLSPTGEVSIHKRLSTPDAPERAILEGIEALGLSDTVQTGKLAVVHGSTVATNAALEGKGVRTAYIGNRGFADLLTIGRQTRPELYNLQPKPISPPVPPELCMETGGRLDARGQIIEPLSDEDLTELLAELERLAPEAVAINLLFSFLNDEGERRIETAITQHFERQGKTLFTSRSSFVLPEYREYERGTATWLNAWLGPLVQRYLARLEKGLAPCSVSVMQSSGGTIDAAQAGQRAVNMLLSGPAGGLAAARFMGNQLSAQGDSEHLQTSSDNRLLTFDMGGTSTDVALIDGDIQLTSEGRIGPYPVAVPMVDMHTIGAGGGSIAWLDAGGMLQVGPESAGASPGPACYGRGGERPTVTDANAVLGRLRPEAFLGGAMDLDLEAARAAIATIAKPMGLSIEETAAGIVELASDHMVQALRVISVAKGYDPKEFSLCCFGGAGGLHLCQLADALGMERALVPIHGGVLSALGMLVAPRQRQLSRTQISPLSSTNKKEMEQHFAALEVEGRKQLKAEGVPDEQIEATYSIDLRYLGQSHSLNVSWQDIETSAETFHRLHQQRFGHRLDSEIELVNVRVALNAELHPLTLPNWRPTTSQPERWVKLWGMEQEVRCLERDELAPGAEIEGPALITETVTTTLLATGWKARVDQLGNLQLQRNK